MTLDNSVYTDKFDYLYVEPTSFCSLKCERCFRTENIDSYQPTHLSAEKLRAFLSSKHWENLKTIEYGGNLGDPLMHNDLNALIRTVNEVCPNASHLIHTSGANRERDWWVELLKSLSPTDAVTFSIDGLADTNHIYRVNAKWKSIEDAIDLCVGKVFTHWKMIVFKHNEHQVLETISYAKDKGMDWFLLTKSSLYNSGADHLRPSSRWVSNIKKPENPPEAIDPKCVKSSRHFLTATAEYYPCCWIALSETPSTNTIVKDGFDFDEELNSINQFTKSWECPSSFHPICAEQCGKINQGEDLRTQFGQVHISLAQPMSVIEEIVTDFAKQ